MTESEATDACIPEPTTEVSGKIKAIGKDSVHKICSGQVVLSLAVAVKELVENGIDAGATIVEIKLRDQGLESIEVSDNGSGVEEHNLEGMTAKYHTSKIREFVDLQGVETFGFRGEALSSLCALSDMTIVTRHKNTDVGIKLELDHEGKIKKRSACARPVGTTVTLTNLFSTLPVRKRDFTKNIKKEFSKMCQMLQAYCLVSKGVRIICTNQTAKGNRSTIMQTHGSQSVLANINAIFGSKQVADVIALKSAFNENETTTEQSIIADLTSDTGDSMQISNEDVELLKAANFQLDGIVSSCSHGSGRAAKDRQYYYINNRPCDPRNIAKTVNDVYHRYNVQQYPFVYLNVLLAHSDVDVNLTPDKRQLLVNNEKILLIMIKKALLNTYGNIPSTYKVQNSSIMSMIKVEPKIKVEVDESIVPISTAQNFLSALSQWKRTGNTESKPPPTLAAAKRKSEEELNAQSQKLQKIQSFLTQSREEANKLYAFKSDSDTDDDEAGNQSKNDSSFNIEKINKCSAEYDALTKKSLLNSSTIVERIDCKVLTPAKPQIKIIAPKPVDYAEDNVLNSEKSTDSVSEEIVPLSETKIIKLDSDSDNAQRNIFSNTQMRTTIAEIEFGLNAEATLKKSMKNKAKLDKLRFKTDISPSQNENAEAELQKEISKDSFATMEIIGQFNLGFIIVKLDADLFIVDQHATDEKYNFETLQSTTVLQNQPLAVPQQLELTAVNEMILLDNLEVFEKNGFKFQIDQDAPPTKKVRLLGKPVSKNWEFGKEDIDELIFMLHDAPEGTVCRPSRVRAMFASRACRKSVMIGKALNKSTMKTLIRHMGEIEQPWNCPHGRPTMRHLVNIAMLHDENDPEEQDE
ncbi:mismatch repair endonuclease PMS2 [Teleopsis dalmanni]|uniref:mismatch repair endonuclease PMS2 n=1 Tax=Teleopsis dalmanni TaxID=139649 RepID=UPI0018CF120D|nr:mismatch repair endonuclease PMS2 [Teleopsis dalmanni]